MPYRLLSKKNQYRLMKASFIVPFIIFTVGFSISAYLTVAFYQSEARTNYTNMVLSAKEHSKQFELNILNNTLRVQSLIDIFGSRPSKVVEDKIIVDEILRNSIFQHIAIYQRQKALSVDGLPILKRINSGHLTRDELLKSNSPYMISYDARKKIKSMNETGNPSSFTFSENEVGEFATLIWKISSDRNEYVLFSSPLESLFSDSVSAPKAQLVISDEDTDFKLLVSWDDKGRIKTTKGLAITKFENSLESLLLVESKIKGSPALTFKWYMSSTQKVEPMIWVIFFVGIVITALFSFLMRFVLSQNRQVASLVVKRTEDLEIALNEATEANLAKTRFLGNMSHELRTPLNLILGMLELIEEKNKDFTMGEYLKSIRVSGDHLLRLISDLLDMAKQDSREISIKSLPIRLPFFIEEICRLVGTDVRKKELDFHVRIDADVPELIKGDSARLRQILMNLLRNSIKYTVKGSIQLNLSCVKQASTNKFHKTTLRFEVKDTGVGIPKGKQNQIFDRFLQLDSSIVLSQGGVGLGLSIVKDLVHILNGNITVRSEVGVGSSFAVDLDFESLSDLNWDASYDLSSKNNLNVAVMSDDKEFLLDVQKSLPAQLIKTAINPENFTDSSYTHIIVDQKCSLDLTPLMDVRFKNKLIMVNYSQGVSFQEAPYDMYYVDSCPIMPTPLLSSLGVNRVETKLNMDEPVLQNKSIEQQSKKTQKNLIILIADDDAGNRQLFQAYLNDYRWTLLFSENGQDAFDKIQKFKPDVVVADLRMPIMDGFELTDRIRDFERMNSIKQTPIILVTADALDQTEEMARHHGVSHFLTKPVRKSKFIDTIFSVIES